MEDRSTQKREVESSLAKDIAVRVFGGLAGVALVSLAIALGLWGAAVVLGAIAFFRFAAAVGQLVRRRRDGTSWAEILQRKRSHEEAFVVDKPFLEVIATGEHAFRSITGNDPDIEWRRGRVRGRTGQWLDPGDRVVIQVGSDEGADHSRVLVKSAPAWRGDFGPDCSRENVAILRRALTT